METWLYSEWETLLKVAVSCFLIVCALAVIVRFTGLRTFAKMTSIDFASTVAIGSMLSSVILSSSVSVLEGIVGLVTICLTQLAFASLVRKSDGFDALATNKPVLLMYQGEILHENLKKTRVDMSDLRGKLREANVIELSEVRAVVFETTGDVSVLHSKDPDKQLDDLLLEGVTGKDRV